jgi:hypothetical protein
MERNLSMPVTRSELLFLCGGAVAGALAAKNYEKIKEKTGPLLAAAGGAVGDAYTAAARRVGEKLESMQDAMAEGREAAGAGAGAAAASDSANPHFSTANGTTS